MSKRVIALVDCDSFFVSCEEADDKRYKGTPMCVISGKNGCVISRSKEAKMLGVRMGMPMFMASKEFPEANYIVADHNKYHKYSKLVMNCLKEFSPDVEIVSIDEAYVDLTGTQKLFKKNYEELCKYIRKYILENTDIPVSIGLSSSKLLAKLASDKAKKTGGFYEIKKDNLMSVLEKTEINEICGIGNANTLILKRNGILLASELVNKEDDWIKTKLGINGVEIRHELLGECISNVDSKYEPPKSIQDTSTICDGTFSDKFSVIKSELSRHLHNACSRLRYHNGKCSVIGVLLRTKEFAVYYDKEILIKPTDFEITLQKEINKILSRIYKEGILYRGTGIVLEKLTFGEEQLSIFTEKKENEKERSLSKCIDNIEKKFGKNSIRTGFL